jgi:hypothetical protein
VAEELRLLDEAQERLGRAAGRAYASEDEIIEELQHIQEMIRGGKSDDRSAFEQQYEHLVRLLEQLRRGRPTERPDPANPYFAHMRLTSDGRTFDVLLGKATCLEDGLRIVDWRHAPISRIYYRYAEGDEYEEDLGVRTVEGIVRARRSVAPAGARPLPPPPPPAAPAPPEPPPFTGADLAAYRASLGLSQGALAERLGTTQGTVSKAEGNATALLGPTLRRAMWDAQRGSPGAPR